MFENKDTAVEMHVSLTKKQINSKDVWERNQPYSL